MSGKGNLQLPPFNINIPLLLLLSLLLNYTQKYFIMIITSNSLYTLSVSMCVYIKGYTHTHAIFQCVYTHTIPSACTQLHKYTHISQYTYIYKCTQFTWITQIKQTRMHTHIYANEYIRTDIYTNVHPHRVQSLP